MVAVPRDLGVRSSKNRWRRRRRGNRLDATLPRGGVRPAGLLQLLGSQISSNMFPCDQAASPSGPTHGLVGGSLKAIPRSALTFDRGRSEPTWGPPTVLIDHPSACFLRLVEGAKFRRRSLAEWRSQKLRAANQQTEKIPAYFPTGEPPICELKQGFLSRSLGRALPRAAPNDREPNRGPLVRV